MTLRGAKHLRELRAMVRLGHRAALVFFVHRADAASFDAAREIDPAYALELDLAAADGVQILPVAAAHAARSAEPDGLWTLGWSLPGLLPWVRRARPCPFLNRCPAVKMTIPSYSPLARGAP